MKNSLANIDANRKAILDQMTIDLETLNTLEKWQRSMIKNQQLLDFALNNFGKSYKGLRQRALTLAIDTFEECSQLEQTLTEAKAAFINTLKEADGNAVKRFYLQKIQEKYGNDIANLIKNKIDFKGDLPNKEGIAVELTEAELDILTREIDPGFNNIIDNEIDPFVKHQAHEMFEAFLKADQELDGFVDNLVIDIDNQADMLA